MDESDGSPPYHHNEAKTTLGSGRTVVFFAGRAAIINLTDMVQFVYFFWIFKPQIRLGSNRERPNMVKRDEYPCWVRLFGHDIGGD
jgi:hypothetical protein